MKMSLHNQSVQDVYCGLFADAERTKELLKIDDSVLVLIEQLVHNSHIVIVGMWQQPAHDELEVIEI